MEKYLNIFIDSEYPEFINKYLNTSSLTRLKSVSQFCGCDYTNLYNPLFFYSRFDHSLVVAHMTWHFTHDKKSTIAALLHDIGTPCFAHTIDYVFGDYLKQESSEKNIVDLINQDEELLNCLKEDEISISILNDLTKFPILENKTPQLCTDRLDGVLHTCYVWLHTHTLDKIKEVYDNLVVLYNESNITEIGFQNTSACETFVDMVLTYAKELQSNRDKYVMNYISELIKISFRKNLISLEDLYEKKESEIIEILKSNFVSWKIFNTENNLICSEEMPDNFYVSIDVKKRNVIPLVKINGTILRINEASQEINAKFKEFDNFKDTKYAYLKRIKKLV